MVLNLAPILQNVAKKMKEGIINLIADQSGN
jgi:hypothetical protein